MAEEIMNQTTVEEDYIEKLQQLKATTVSREEYDRVRADNKKMLDAMFNGASTQADPQPQVEKVDIQALRDELYGGKYEGTDLDYVTKSLKLRKALMDEGHPDPFVSCGQNTTATPADYERAEWVGNEMQKLVDNAHGNPEVFRSELVNLKNRR